MCVCAVWTPSTEAERPVKVRRGRAGKRHGVWECGTDWLWAGEGAGCGWEDGVQCVDRGGRRSSGRTRQWRSSSAGLFLFASFKFLEVGDEVSRGAGKE